MIYINLILDLGMAMLLLCVVSSMIATMDCIIFCGVTSYFSS